jgi:hypothetical protein
MIRFAPALAFAVVAVALPGLAVPAVVVFAISLAVATERAVGEREP